MYEKILVPLDGSKFSESSLPYVEDLVSKLSPATKVEIILLQVLAVPTHVSTVDIDVVISPFSDREMEPLKQNANKYLEKVAERLKAKGAVVTTKVATGQAGDEIMRIADELNADLIVMSTHGKGAVSRWAFGGVTDRVLRRGNKPVLTCRCAELMD